MHISGNAKIYTAFTLIEMLVVLAILSILGTVTAQSFNGLQSSVKMNEESLNLSQDIQNLQRSAMLLERGSGENWLYGLGIDFSQYSETGEYRMFKWCSQYSGYGSVKTRGELPDFDNSTPVGINNGYLPAADWRDTCSSEEPTLNSYLVIWETGSPTLTELGLGPEITTDVRYILFESVSGRAFFYNSSGELLNYDSSGNLTASPVDLTIRLTTKATIKSITVKNLSGRILINAQSND